jgi:hypothetical protein
MIVIATLLALGAQTMVDPLAPASDGKVQCYRPDRTRKTCRSISVITRTGPVSYDVAESVMVSAAPPIVFSNHTTVNIVSGAACGVLRAADVDKGIIALNGAPMDASSADRLRDRIKSSLAPLFGKQICQTYEAHGDGFIQHSTVNGVARADLDEPMIWVRPAEGYAVAP